MANGQANTEEEKLKLQCGCDFVPKNDGFDEVRKTELHYTYCAEHMYEACGTYEKRRLYMEKHGEITNAKKT